MRNSRTGYWNDGRTQIRDSSGFDQKLPVHSPGVKPPTCDEIVDLRHSACGHNNDYYHYHYCYCYYSGACGPFLPSKPLFAPSVRGPPGHPATQNLDRLVPWLEQALLRAGCVPSSPQTRARRNVARGVEVLRGTPSPPHHVIARAAAAAGSQPVMIMQSDHQS